MNRWLLLPCAALALLYGCSNDDAAGDSPAELELDVAITSALAGGPVEAKLSTSSAVGRYAIEGDLDVRDATYRLCGQLNEKPEEPFEGDHPDVFLGDGAGEYRTLLKFKPTSSLPASASYPDDAEGCSAKGWLDDHPPSLPLFEYGPDGGPGFPGGGEYGAESYMQLALLALTEFKKGAGAIEGSGENDYELPFNFLEADTPPEGRNEDRWQMEPLMRRAGTTDLQVVTENGSLKSLSFQAPGELKGKWAGPVDVSFELGAPGSGAPVPSAVVYAME